MIDNGSSFLPPALFGIILITGSGLDWLIPLQILPPSLTLQLLVGGIAFATSAAIGVWALMTFRHAGMLPAYKEPLACLIENGPYRYSRNPMYIALGMVLLGFSFLLNTLWLIMGVPILLITLDQTTVPREERYLQHRFGKQYELYSRKVRRWI